MPVPALVATSYHARVRDVLREHERGLWDWFASDEFGAEQAQHVRLELLKATYRLEPTAHPDLYRAAGEVLRLLEVDAPVTFYQATGETSMNAGLCFVPGEAHVVLAGPVLARLDAGELRALLGHELAHYRLWTSDGGSFLVANHLLESVAGRPSAPASWVMTAVRQRRYTEVFADRGALVGCEGDLHAAVRCLLKVTTGIEAPDAGAYMRQVAEVLGKSADVTEAESHPELFLRAWAMEKWLTSGAAADEELASRIEGEPTLETLDLLGQHDLTRRTREVLAAFLRPAWMRTEGVIAHARPFFERLELDTSGSQGETSATAAGSEIPAEPTESVGNFLSYALLDLVTADPDLDDVALAWALVFAQQSGLGEAFDKLARKELRLTAAKTAELRRQWPSIEEKLRAQAQAMEARA